MLEEETGNVRNTMEVYNRLLRVKCDGLVRSKLQTLGV